MSNSIDRQNGGLNLFNRSNYHDNPTIDRFARHTFGRVECVLLTSVFVGNFLGQGAKFIAKAPIMPVAVAISWATTEPVPDSLSLDGWGKDAAMLLQSVDKITQSALGIIFAPPKDYQTLKTALAQSVDSVILGSYHNNYENAQEAFKDVMESGPSYTQLITDAYSSYKKAY